MLSSQYFWVSLITSTCWAFFLTYPYLVQRQLSQNPFEDDDWKREGSQLAELEDNNYLELIPKSGIFFYLIVMTFEIGFLIFLGTIVLGYILAFFAWSLIFRHNPITTKIIFLVIWYGVTIYFLIFLFI